MEANLQQDSKRDTLQSDVAKSSKQTVKERRVESQTPFASFGNISTDKESQTKSTLCANSQEQVDTSDEELDYTADPFYDAKIDTRNQEWFEKHYLKGTAFSVIYFSCCVPVDIIASTEIQLLSFSERFFCLCFLAYVWPRTRVLEHLLFSADLQK